MGTVQIQKGKVIVKDEPIGTSKAVIHTHPEIILRVNGTEISDVTKVEEKDKIEIMPREAAPKRTFVVRSEKDYLAAYGMIQYHKGRKVFVVDTEEAEEIRVQVHITEESAAAYTYSEIIEELKKVKIVYGIQEDGINQLISNPGLEIQIAQGEDAQKGVDGFIEYLFYSNEEGKNKEDINERVDFKNVHEILTVKKGELIARRTPPVYGKKGINIYGKEIKALSVKSPTFIPGDNVKMDDEGLAIFSRADGKPAIRGKVVHVFSVHEVFQDVDIESGNIDFYGDVIIRGDVKEGMTVKAGHNITIYGAVSGGHIEAGGDVIIKNWIIQSSIIAGAQQAEVRKLYQRLAKIQGLLLQLFKGSMEVLKKFSPSQKTNVQTGKIVAIVLEKHFNEIILLLKELELTDRPKLQSIIDDSFYSNMKYFIKKYSIYGVLGIQDIEEIKEDILLLGTMKEKLESSFDQPMNITLSYAQNAMIKTSGNIYITGQGCLNSNLYAGESVLMDKEEEPSKPSVFRGGKIQCSKEVRISEIGSTGGAYTEIETDRQGKVLFNILYYNSHIQIGEGKKKIEETLQKGMVYRNSKGDIMIHSAI